MANICNNKFTICLKENFNQDLEDVINSLENIFKNILDGEITYQDDFIVEGYFDSKWVFPIDILKNVFKNKHVYFRCLSEEYGTNYVAMNIYDNEWKEEQCFNF